MNRTVLAVAAGAVGALGVFAGPALATTPHVHELTTGNGETHDVAAGLCHSRWEKAGENFHSNVHFGGPNESEGAPAVSITRD